MRFNVISFIVLASLVVAINAKNDINRVKIARRSVQGSQRSAFFPRQEATAEPAATDPAAATSDASAEPAAAASDAASGAASAASDAASAASAAVPPTPAWNPSASVDCTYNSDGCLTEASTHGCPIQVQPPSDGKGTSCSTGGGKRKRLLSAFPIPNQLLNLDILNCDTLCILSDCPAQQSCSVESSDGSFINVQALNCDNLYILSSASK